MSDDFYYHLNTKNKSFLRTSKELKRRGTANNKFFLKLYDKSLMKVNPLLAKDKITRSKVIAEIIRNPWYYYREIARVPVPGGSVRFNLHLGNLATLYCMHNNISSFIEMPRQQGKTIGIACGFGYIITFGTKNSTIIYGNKAGEDAELNLKRTLDILRLLPEWLRFMNPGLDVDNVRTFVNAKNKNTIKTVAAPKDPPSADKIGRGLTTPMQWEDEFAFKTHNDIVYEAAGPALSQAKAEAKKFHKPHFRVISTTPNNRDIPAGSYAYAMKEDALRFSEDLYDLDIASLESHIFDNSHNDFVYVKYEWKELGRDKKWYEEQCRALNGNRLKIKREVDLNWPLSTDNSFFSEEQLENIKSFEKNALASQFSILNRYKLQIVEGENFDPRIPYVLGLDMATGANRDASALVVTDPYTERPVAYFENNKIDTEDLKKFVTFLMTAILPNSILAPERNSIGIAVITALLKNPVISKRIYFYYRLDTATKRIADKISRVAKKSKLKIFGIDTTAGSRGTMFETLQLLVNEEPGRFVLDRINEQIGTLEQKKNGKIEHSSSAKDDVLMAYLLSIYAIRDRKNLGKILSAVSSSNFSNGTSMNSISKMNKIQATPSNDMNINGSATSNTRRTVRFEEYTKSESSFNHNRSVAKRMDSIFKLNG